MRASMHTCQRAWLPWFVALCTVFGAVAARAELTVRAAVDRHQVAVGESLTLEIQTEGAQSVTAPAINVPGFQARYVGPNTQVSIVNGAWSASVTHRYLLVARQAGPATLGPFTVEHDGKQYATEPIQVTVTAPGQRPQLPGGAPAAGSPDVFLTLQPAKREMYVGERVPLTIRLIRRARVDNAHLPEVQLDGVLIDKLEQPQETQEIINGSRYAVWTFNTMLTPLRPGEVALGPARMAMDVLVSRRGDLFDDFFAQRKPFEAHADAVRLTVRPLPNEGRPASFGGAVGRFDFTLDARPTELNAGDPVTIRTQISGSGNLNGVEPPRVQVDERFRAYDPVPIKEGEQAGRKGFEQVVIPKQAGELEIAPLQFSYFDPEEGRYVTITRGPIRLAVRAAAQPQNAAVFSMEKPEPALAPQEKLGRDIVYIKDAPGSFGAPTPGFHRTVWFVLLQLLPPLAFAGAAVLLQRRERLRADPRRVRFLQAGKEVRRRLGEVSALNGAAFYDGLSAALCDYLGAKLDLPPGAVEARRVAQRLSGCNGLGAVSSDVDGLFELIERVRYAPAGAAQGERERALGMATAIVDRLEREKGLAERIVAPLLLAAVLGGTLAAGAVQAQDPHGEFYRGNQAYKDGNYDEAVRAYEGVIASGRASGALFFNLGNAHMKKGELGRAILNYERALRLLPNDPDVMANLAYAREQAKDEAEPAPLWWRLLFPLAERARTATLAWAWTGLWALFWAVLALRFAWPQRRQVVGRAAWAVGLVAVVVGASLAARLAEVDLQGAAVVVQKGEAPVRFEPSEAGTEHFKVGEGTHLEVTQEQGDWVQVRRRDGRRGWLHATVIGRVEG